MVEPSSIPTWWGIRYGIINQGHLLWQFWLKFLYQLPLKLFGEEGTWLNCFFSPICWFASILLTLFICWNSWWGTERKDAKMHLSADALLCFFKKGKMQRCICLKMLQFVFLRKERCKYSLVKSKFQKNKQECSNKAFLASSSLSMS